MQVRGLTKLAKLWNGKPSFGDLNRLTPISDQFGFDRGTPVDRRYIEAFLAANSAAIQGHVLEIGDDSYTRRFGGERVATSDVLHINPTPMATIIGDLAQPGVLPQARFDCAIVTQTLHLIYDMAAAVRQLHSALRPDGLLLLTVPGISQLARDEWGATWYWSLTPLSAERLVGDIFGPENVTVGCHGNVFAATAFLYGIAAEELPARKLDVADPAYPVTITVMAVRRDHASAEL